jgi:hypothetical protein
MVMNTGEDCEHEFSDGMASLYRCRLGRVERRRGQGILFDKALEAQALSAAVLGRPSDLSTA